MKTLETAIYTEDSSFLKEFIRILQYTLEKSGIVPNLYTFQEAEFLKKDLAANGRFAVLFLDMDSSKPAQQLAEAANTLPVSPLLILLSSSELITHSMLRLQPFRIIRKNAVRRELGECLSAVIHHVPDAICRPYVVLKSCGSLYRLNLNHIRYMESQNKILHIAMKNAVLDLRYSINEAEQLLQYHHFLRIHKSFLVNADFILQIDPAQVLLDDGTVLPLSRYRAQNVKEQFQEIFRWNIL